MQKRKNILICPLEWGLGHAGRMVPVARKLIAMDNNIFIGSGENHLAFFRKELPGLTYIHFPGFTTKYSRRLPQYFLILLRLPALIMHSAIEHLRLKKIIKHHNIDIVISDGRIGLWNKNITTVLFTHMMRVPFPKRFDFLDNAGIHLVRVITGKFSRCFIPDLPGEINISGRLSHGINIAPGTRFTGLLSRFDANEPGGFTSLKKYYCLVILSGPEPQRSVFKKKMEEILESHARPSVILEGVPEEETRHYEKGNITYISHLTANEMQRLISESENLVTRAGYSTVMELISLNRSALIIPTPGQTEQEYLAEHLSGKGWFKTVSQNNLSADTDLQEIKASYPARFIIESEILLTAALNELLEDQHQEPGYPESA